MATQLWAWQDGTTRDDSFVAVGMESNGSSVFAGFADQASATDTELTTLWTAMKLDADGGLLWTWEDDRTGDETDFLRAAVMGEDGSVVMAGSGADSFQVIKLDADGTFVWRYQPTHNGTGFGDYAGGIAMGDDGSVVVGGATVEDWYIPNLGGWDMVAVKLDAEGNVLWKWQGGTVETEFVTDVAMANDGSVVISGSSNGDFMGVGVSVSGSSSSSLTENYNFIAVQLDSEGSEGWRWQDGPTGDDNRMSAASITEDGSFVLAGYTEGDWDGVSAGGQDFVAVKLDTDGNEVWRYQEGTSGNDGFYTLTARDDGTVVLGGYTEGDWNSSNAGGNDFAIVALDADGEEIWRWQNGSAATTDLTGGDYVIGMSSISDGRIILAGRTYGSFVSTNLGESDFVAVMLDTGALGTPSPTTVASPSAAPPSSSPTPTTSSPPSAGPISPVASTPTPSSTVTPATPFAPTPAPTPAAMPAISSGTTQGSSNVVPIASGVASAVAGAALIALGLFLLKRKHDKNSGTAQQVHPPAAAVDRVNGPPTLQRTPALPPPPPYMQAAAAAHQKNIVPPPPPYQPAMVARQENVATPPPPYQHLMVAASDADAVGGDRKSTFPAAFSGALRHGAEPTKQPRKDGGDRYSLSKTDTESVTNAGRYGGGGGVAIEGREPELTTHGGGGGGSGGGGGEGRVGIGEEEFESSFAEPAMIVTTSTDNISTGERNVFAPAYGGDGVMGQAFVTDEPKPTLEEIGVFSSTEGRGSAGPPGLGRAVGEAALELARNCLIPGVSEAAAAVSILVELLAGNNDTKNNTEPSLRRCRSIVMMLQRAAKVLGKGGDTTGKAERAMMEDVHDAIFDLVELIKTYQSKNRLSQLLMSTLFRRRQDEMGAVVDRAILSLQLGLQVQVGNDVSAFKDDMHLYKGSMEEAQSKSLADARRARRQRKLDKIEIPEDHVAITDELLGKGGFGEVYLADYNGRNAAAKVLHISNDLGKRGENDILDGPTGEQVERQREKSQRKSFLLELDAMIRLRSPYTVNVYGAVTAMPDRLVLVMELLSGGDLRTLLGSCENPLPEQQSRQIIGDICAGMAFLHSKEAVHGDLKSANVLLDGAGRAKIGDFGTSRWTQHTMSTGLATFTANSSKSTHMSLAWSAPEVLHASGSTYASDVYSFGIVVWEVLSRELPWATVTNPKELFIRVVLNDLRPAMPDDAPTDIADMARACWVDKPKDRPTFSAIMERMKANGWNQ